MYRIGKLTEEGKALFSFQFDETQNMDDVRCVSNTRTGEIILAIKVPAEKSKDCIKIKPRTITTQKGVWELWHDGYDYCITRIGDRV